MAIRKEAGLGFGLIVTGVSAHPGDDLFFANTARCVLINAKKPFLFEASGPSQRPQDAIA
jgi:hypothetical protein